MPAQCGAVVESGGVNRFERFVMRAPIGLYRIGLGGLLGKRFLLLQHTGRKSGLPRKTVLEVVELDDHGSPVIVSGYGEQSDWFRNVTADPEVVYTLGRRPTSAIAERLGGEEAKAVFDRYRRAHPRAAAVIGERIGVSLVDDVEAAAEALPLLRLVAR